MDEYTILMNMRFITDVGPKDYVSTNTWKYNNIAYTASGLFGEKSCTFTNLSNLTRANGDSMNVGEDEEFTISFWIKTILSNNDHLSYLFSDNSSNINSNTLYFDKNNYIVLYDNLSNCLKSEDISTKFIDDAWNHVLITRDINNVTSMFLNGERIGYTTDIKALIFDSVVCTIGKIDDKATFSLAYLDDIVIIKNYSYAIDPSTSTIAIPSNYFILYIDPSIESDLEGWEDEEKKFSRYDEIVDLIEDKRFHTKTVTNELQNGLVPYLITPNWKLWKHEYPKNGKAFVSMQYDVTNIDISHSIKNICRLNGDSLKYFEGNLKDLIDSNTMIPFILFINNKMVPWSDISVVKSNLYLTLVVKGYSWRYAKDVIKDVRIVVLPFNVSYSEEGKLDEDSIILFTFNKDGLLKLTDGKQPPDIVIGSKQPNIRTLTYRNKYFKDFYINTDMNVKITETNAFIFDQNGYLLPDIKKTVGAGNILNTSNTNICNAVIIYHKDENKSEDYFQRILNAVDYGRDAATGKVSGTTKNKRSGIDKLLDSDQMVKEYDFTHSAKLDYDTNIENSINYTFDYDKNLFDPIFEEIRPVSIVPMDTADLLKRMDSNKYITISRDIYSKQDDRSSTECIILVNGELPYWYKYLTKTNTTIRFPGYALKESDKVEIIYFRNIQNDLFKLDIDNKDESDYLYLPSNYIPKEDLLIYTNKKSDYDLLPILYEYDEISKSVSLYDKKYIDNGIYIGSKLQFRYANVPVYRESNMLLLPSSKFKSCYNPDKYIIFVNGRLLSKSSYKMLVPSLTNSKIEVKALYTTNTLSTDDRVDIFYYGGDFTSRVEYSSSINELVFRTVKLYAVVDDQRDFELTTPYKDYIIDDMKNYGFMVFRDSLFISDSMYYVTKNEDSGKYTISFLDPPYREFIVGDCITVVVPVYKDNYNTEDPISDNNRILIDTRYFDREEDNEDLVLAPDGIYYNLRWDTVFPTGVTGDLNDIACTLLFRNTELLGDNKYYIHGPNFLEHPNLNPPYALSLVILTDKYDLSTNRVTLAYQYIHPERGEKVFSLNHTDLPKESYIVFRNEKLVDPDEYIIARGLPGGDTDKLIWPYGINDLYHEDTLTVVAIADSSSVKYAIKFSHYYADYSSDTTAVINNYDSISFGKNNSLVFVNGEFIAGRYLSFNSNTITFLTRTITKNDKIIVYTAYKTMNIAKFGKGVSEEDEINNIKFSRARINATKDNQESFKVPSIPNMDFSKRNKFILFIRGQFVPAQYYTLNSEGTTLTLEDSKNIKKGDIVDFVFCANQDIDIDKVEYSMALTDSTVILPTTFDESLDLNTHMMIFYGSTFIDNSRYHVNNDTRTIVFDDIPYSKDNNRLLTVVIFYDVSSNAGAVEELNENGYLKLGESSIDRNYNKNLYLLFVNGKKIHQDDILDVTNNIKKITSDIKTTYGVEVLKFSPLVVELQDRYRTIEELKYHLYTITIPQAKEQTVYVICNGFRHSISFQVEEGATFTAYSAGGFFGSKPPRCWIPGKVSPASGTVHSDVTISVGEATVTERMSFTIKSTDHQTIYVKCNDRLYASDNNNSNLVFGIGGGSEVPNSEFTAYIEDVEEGWEAGTLNYTSGTITKGLVIQATAATRKSLDFQILNKNLENQTITLHIFNDEGEVTIMQGPGTYKIPYGYYIYFDIVANPGYGGGTTLSNGLFEQEKPYKIETSYYGLVPDPVEDEANVISDLES